MLGYTRGKTREGCVGGFSEPERAVRGAPEVPRVLRGNRTFPHGESCRRGRTYRRRQDCRRGRVLDDSAKSVLCGSCVAEQLSSGSVLHMH